MNRGQHEKPEEEMRGLTEQQSRPRLFEQVWLFL